MRPRVSRPAGAVVSAGVSDTVNPARRARSGNGSAAERFGSLIRATPARFNARATQATNGSALRRS